MDDDADSPDVQTNTDMIALSSDLENLSLVGTEALHGGSVAKFEHTMTTMAAAMSRVKADIVRCDKEWAK